MNLPNKITTLRMILVVFVATFLLLPSEWFMTIPYIDVSLNFFIAWILFIIASLSDMLDGKIARKYNMVTDYGKFMDPIADKLLVNTTLIILASYGPIRVNVICVIIMIARDIVVDAVRLNAMRKNVVVAANIFGKLKTVFQMVAIILIMVNDFNLDSLLHLNDNYYLGQLFMYIATLTSLISGIIYVIQNRNVFSEMK
ncbi:MAG: CDP-diacylglycerol--glycerol-3-phosphate 3-phosphatidyltransferase [Bacilli bacterium]